MKKLILLQNDFAGSGKSTIVRLMRRYLNQHHVEHQFIVLDEEETSIESDAEYFNPYQGGAKALVAALDRSPITFAEIASGMGEIWMKNYEQHEFYNLMHEMGVDVTVVLPVTSDAESFDAVTEAAEVYSDNVQYLIAHSTTSAYEENNRDWDRSYAARVMDMFEAVELRFPSAANEMENNFRLKHTNLPASLLEVGAEESYGKEYVKWLRRSMGQIETARQYLFGDAFRALADHSDEPVKRNRRKAEKLTA
jgi:hypothetical protein